MEFPGQKLEWVAFPFSRGSSQPKDRTQVSRIAGRFFTSWATREAKNTGVGSLSLSSASSQPRNQSRDSCIAGRFFTSWEKWIFKNILMSLFLKSGNHMKLVLGQHNSDVCQIKLSSFSCKPRISKEWYAHFLPGFQQAFDNIFHLLWLRSSCV